MDGCKDQGQQEKDVRYPAQAAADHQGSPMPGVKLGASGQAGLVFALQSLSLVPPGALAIQVGRYF